MREFKNEDLIATENETGEFAEGLFTDFPNELYFRKALDTEGLDPLTVFAQRDRFVARLTQL